MRIAILGNSGSGKSTLAGWLAARTGAPVLDLDTVAWEPGLVAVSRPTETARNDVRSFCMNNISWVVEGCYANLIRAALEFEPLLVFLNPGEAQCLDNCRSRPWERHKYSSMAEQNERLEFLRTWVTQYYTREGEMSLADHTSCFVAYPGRRVKLVKLPCLDPPSREVISWFAPA